MAPKYLVVVQLTDGQNLYLALSAPDESHAALEEGGVSGHHTHEEQARETGTCRADIRSTAQATLSIHRIETAILLELADERGLGRELH